MQQTIPTYINTIPQAYPPYTNNPYPSIFIQNQPPFSTEVNQMTRSEKIKKFFGELPLFSFLAFFWNTLQLALQFILMWECLSHLLFPFICGFFLYVFLLFVWLPLAKEIEKSTGTIKYGVLYTFNYSILNALYFVSNIFFNNKGFYFGSHNLSSIPFCFIKMSCFFAFFEIVLIAYSNKEKKTKFFCCNVKNKIVPIVLGVTFCILFNLTITIIVGVYTGLYHKYINAYCIKDERISKIENWFKSIKSEAERRYVGRELENGEQISNVGMNQNEMMISRMENAYPPVETPSVAENSFGN